MNELSLMGKYLHSNKGTKNKIVKNDPNVVICNHSYNIYSLIIDINRLNNNVQYKVNYLILVCILLYVMFIFLFVEILVVLL